jgi:anionic cell wall polymer biosynthesis LytR-Cps2A-Psr (LCP) family protein
MKKIPLWAILVGVFILGFSLTYLVLTLTKAFSKGGKLLPTPNSYSLATPQPINENSPKKGVYTILFLGHGGAGHEGSMLTDSIITVHIDTNTKKIAFISIPRDLWVSGNHKINSIGATQGYQNLGPVIQSVTGLPINYYVAVDFGGFSKIINDLGGITVTVPATFDDPFYPIPGEENNTCGITEDQIFVLKNKYTGYNLETQFTCRYEHLHYDKGTTNLDGTAALKFVRSRHGDSDFARSLRQFAVLVGIKDKLISLQAANKFDDIVNTLFKIVKTDLDVGIVKSLVQVFGDPKGYTINQIQLTTSNLLNEGKSADGQYILTPKAGNLNFSEIKSYINTSFAN